MLFTEFRFAVFFAVVLGVYWTLRSNRPRKLWLLAASYSFYAAWDWRFLSLVLLSTAVDFLVAAAMPTRTPATRRVLLWTSLTVNLGILAVFKYFDFFADSAVAFSNWLGLPVSTTALDLILPLGISFYTFQTLSYTIDVYRDKLAPTDSPVDFALFVCFFPQLVAGPIVRAINFLPQLSAARPWRDVRVRACLTLFLVGFIKKSCLADHAAVAVDAVFSDPDLFGAASKWLAASLYSLQIYCDFSGYSDMAIASAGLLGFRLPENFTFPYLADSMREFWRRWHISLSTWFRDYLYIPLGGNRSGRARTTFNLLAVFFLCGLWHGAAWTFVLWGLFHGAFLVAERFVPIARAPRVLRHVYVVLVVVIGFVIFRSPDIQAAFHFIIGLIGVDGDAARQAATFPEALGKPALNLWWWGVLAGFTSVHVVTSRASLPEIAERVPALLFAPAFGAVVGLVLPWIKTGYQPFIYFQF